MNEMTKKIIKIALPVGFALYGSYCLLKSFGYAEEYTIPKEHEIYFEQYDSRTNYSDRGLSRESKVKLQEEYDFHHFHAVRCYQEAYNHLWYYPVVSWRDRSRQAWIAACAMIGCTTATGRLVMAFSAMLSQHGVDIIDDWDFVAEKLKWALYHFEQCEKIAQRLHG
jgi:hypothetical protein